MALSYRTVTISLEQQTQGATTLRFLPTITGASGETLLQRYYSVRTAADGTGSIELPVKATGTIAYTYQIPRAGNQISTGVFHLAAGAEISLDQLMQAA